MKTINNMFIGAALLGAVGIALATPPISLSPPFLSTGTDPEEIRAHGVAQSGEDEFHVRLTTNGPSDMAVQLGAFAPGGSIGWHSHPGLVTLQLISGTIEWYDETCNATVYKAGDAWTEGSAPHYFRNIGTTTAQVIATFVVSHGAGFRVDQPEPACAIALGLK